MKSPFLVPKELEKQINIEMLLLAGLIAPAQEIESSDTEDYKGQYCLTLDGINYSWVTLKIIRDFVIEKNELDIPK